MNNTEYLRDRLLTAAGLGKPAPYKGLTYDQIHKQECSDGFCELMDNRLVMGFLRYGPMLKDREPFKDLQRARQCLDNYMKTGNTEYLVDAANYCRCEKLRSKHPNKHFHAIDR